MTVEQIITLITLIVGLVGAIAALIPTLVKLLKTIKELVANKNWAKLTMVALDAMREVENYYREHPDMTSEEKLDMAIAIIEEASLDLGVEITDKLVDDLTNYIKETINWANEMKK